jgi:hypothetical protein
MAPQRENKYMQMFYSAALTILIGLSSWTGINIIQLKVDVARLTAERVGDHENAVNDHTEISAFRLRMYANDSRNDQQDERIRHIEAMLPEVLRKRKPTTE